MNIFILILAFILISLSLGAKPKSDDDWNNFKKLHKKNYNNTNEEKRRKSIWNNNSEQIKKHNLNGSHKFKLELNEYSDLTDEEYKTFLNGYIRKNRTKPVETLFKRQIIPSSIDWRNKGIVSPIKNQGYCGSCWAFSTIASLEGQFAKKIGKLTQLSEQNLIDCSTTRYGSFGCNGGVITGAFKFILDNKGVADSLSYPYRGRKMSCIRNAPKKAYLSSFKSLDSQTEEELTQAIANIGPISVAIDASLNSFRFYKSGIYSDPACSAQNLNHGKLKKVELD